MRSWLDGFREAGQLACKSLLMMAKACSCGILVYRETTSKVTSKELFGTWPMDCTFFYKMCSVFDKWPHEGDISLKKMVWKCRDSLCSRVVCTEDRSTWRGIQVFVNFWEGEKAAVLGFEIFKCLASFSEMEPFSISSLTKLWTFSLCSRVRFLVSHIKTSIWQLFKTSVKIFYFVLNDNTTTFVKFPNDNVGVVSKLFEGFQFFFVCVFVLGCSDRLQCNFMSDHFLKIIKRALIVNQGIKSVLFNELLSWKEGGLIIWWWCVFSSTLFIMISTNKVSIWESWKIFLDLGKYVSYQIHLV